LDENNRFQPTLPVFWRPFRGDIIELQQLLWHQKTRVPISLSIVQRCLCDSTFRHFGTIPACDRQTDRRTDTGPQHILCEHGIAW